VITPPEPPDWEALSASVPEDMAIGIRVDAALDHLYPADWRSWPPGSPPPAGNPRSWLPRPPGGWAPHDGPISPWLDQEAE